MSQIVYILINESMPGYVKIWLTTGTVEERLRQLDRTWTPLPFECHYAAEVWDAKKEEEWLHSIFADRRVRANREFFKISPELVTLALKRIENHEVSVNDWLTAEQEEEVADIKEKRWRFHFADFGIPIGSKLVFTRDLNIVAEVVEWNKIRIGDKVESLSTMARDLLWYKMRPQGTLFFIYDDEILQDRRDRIEHDRV
jgi:hypothetical protein